MSGATFHLLWDARKNDCMSILQMIAKSLSFHETIEYSASMILTLSVL